MTRSKDAKKGVEVRSVRKTTHKKSISNEKSKSPSIDISFQQKSQNEATDWEANPMDDMSIVEENNQEHNASRPYENGVLALQ